MQEGRGGGDGSWRVDAVARERAACPGVREAKCVCHIVTCYPVLQAAPYRWLSGTWADRPPPPPPAPGRSPRSCKAAHAARQPRPHWAQSRDFSAGKRRWAAELYYINTKKWINSLDSEWMELRLNHPFSTYPIIYTTSQELGHIFSRQLLFILYNFLRGRFTLKT